MNNEEKIIEMLGTMKGQMDTMQGQLDTMQGRMDSIESRMDNMEKTVNGLKEDVKELKLNQKYMWEDIGKLDKHISIVEGDVRQIKERVVINTLDIAELKGA